MTQEQYEEMYNWVYEEIHHNRDSYSRSKIIEMIMHRVEELVNKTNDIHDVILSDEQKEKYYDLGFKDGADSAATDILNSI